MRRKAEVLQYKNSNSFNGQLTKAQKYSLVARRKGPQQKTYGTQTQTYTNPNSLDPKSTNPNALDLKQIYNARTPLERFTPSNLKKCGVVRTSTHASNVPGGEMELYLDPSVPLTNYIVQRRYSDPTRTDTVTKVHWPVARDGPWFARCEGNQYCPEIKKFVISLNTMLAKECRNETYKFESLGGLGSALIFNDGASAIFAWALAGSSAQGIFIFNLAELPVPAGAGQLGFVSVLIWGVNTPWAGGKPQLIAFDLANFDELVMEPSPGWPALPGEGSTDALPPPVDENVLVGVLETLIRGGTFTSAMPVPGASMLQQATEAVEAFSAFIPSGSG